jgi:hypothetical protein
MLLQPAWTARPRHCLYRPGGYRRTGSSCRSPGDRTACATWHRNKARVHKRIDRCSEYYRCGRYPVLWLHRHSAQQTGTFLPSTLGQVPRGLGERDHLPTSDGFQTIARDMLGCAVRIMVNSDGPPIRSSPTRLRMPVGTAANSDDDLGCSPYAMSGLPLHTFQPEVCCGRTGQCVV